MLDVHSSKQAWADLDCDGGTHFDSLRLRAMLQRDAMFDLRQEVYICRCRLYFSLINWTCHLSHDMETSCGRTINVSLIGEMCVHIIRAPVQYSTLDP